MGDHTTHTHTLERSALPNTYAAQHTRTHAHLSLSLFLFRHLVTMAKGQGSGAVYGCGPIFSKYVLFILNLVFFFSGMGLIIFGGLMMSDRVEKLNNIGNMANTLGGIVIAIGAFMFLVSFFGCCGAMKESSGILKVYVAGSMLAIVIEIGLIISLSVPDVVNRILSSEGQKGYLAMDPIARMKFEDDLECCGWKGWIDTYPTLPAQCSNLDGSTRDGCMYKLEADLAHYSSISIGVGATLAAIQLVANILAAVMWRNIKQEDL